MLIFANYPIRQLSPVDGAGDVKLAGTAAKAGGGGGDGAAEAALRAFGHHVD